MLKKQLFGYFSIIIVAFLAVFSIAQALFYEPQGQVLGAGTPTFVQGNFGVSGNNTDALSFPGNTTAADLIVACVNTYNSAASIVPTDTSGNTYTLAAQNIGAGSPSTSSYCYQSVNVAGGADTVTFHTSSGFDIVYAIAEYSGIAITNALDVTATAANSATANWASGTTPATSQASELVVGFFAFQNSSAATLSAGTGFTSRETSASSGQNGMLEDKTVSTIGTQTANTTVSAANGGPGIVMTFKGSGVAGPTPTPTPTPTGIPTPTPTQAPTPTPTGTPTPTPSGSNFYITQNGSGSKDGSSLANAAACDTVANTPRSTCAAFNNPANWGAGANQIHAGITIHVSGTVTAAANACNYMAFQAGGSSGNPVTLLMDSTTNITAPTWGGGCGAIYSIGNNWIVIDGGAAGSATGGTLSGGGVIQATANGSGLTYQILGNGIVTYNCSNCTFKNLTVSNIYVHTSMADEGGDPTGAIYVNGGSNVLITNNVVHDMKWALEHQWLNGDSNITFSNNVTYHVDHGIVEAPSATGDAASNVYVYGNVDYDPYVWDDNGNQNHHNQVHMWSFGAGNSLNGTYVYNNYMYGNFGVGFNTCVYFEAFPTVANNPAIFNNVCNETGTSGHIGNGYIGMGANGGGGGWLIANNTIIGPNGSTIGTGMNSNTTLGTMYNNIIASVSTAIYTQTSPAAIDYQDYYNIGSGGWTGGSPLSSWVTYCQANFTSTGCDAHSVLSNPNLNSNFVPNAGSPVIGTGKNLFSLCNGQSNPGLGALCYDKNNNPRPSSGAWDIGAYYVGGGSGGASGNIYIAQSAAGSANGFSCSNAYALSFFNSSANWGSAAGKIGPGVTVHLCGTISSQMVGRGSGSAGNPITILFEPNAKISLPVCPDNGCVSLNGLSYIIMDGGSTVACGYVNNADVPCNNGAIENTANGTGLANHLPSQAIYATPCNNCEFKNLMIRNLYVRTSTTDLGVNDNSAVRCITLTGSNSSIHNNTMHDSGWCLIDSYNQGDTNVSVYNNELYNIGHGYVLSAGSFSGSSGPFFLHDNHIHGFAVWDDTTGNNSFHQDAVHCFSQNPNGNQISGFYMYNNIFAGPAGASINGYVYIEGSTGPPCMSATSDIYVFNNVFLVDHFSTAGHLGLFSGRPTVYNNTIISTDSNSGGTAITNSGSYGGIGVATSKNNAVGGSFILYSYTPGSWAAGSPDYNVYGYVNSNSDFYCSGQTSFAGWKSCAGNETHSTLQASIGVSTSTGIPSAGSPVLNAGTNLTSQCVGLLSPLCYDKNGVARPTSGAWDAGAYQVSSGGGTGTPLAGDLNLDHTINALDYSIMNSHWLQNFAQADINSDGLVNSIDFAVLKSNWGKTW